ncbi:hypothetical protein ACIBAG_07355 [Streptomyces sp. NPDC051243]|uniref:aromatic-ring hydroxylase C-terminal domain-containing protein n=1 Tax=Streptomyces sp. NPDC051243 TaxID=3365646 RepID=UPI00379831B4
MAVRLFTAESVTESRTDRFADATAVLVRPDGYVAWTSADGEPATAALERWFGPAEQAATAR